MVYVLLLHPLHMLKSCDRTVSPLLNVLNREDMCWFPSAWQTILCAEVHRVISWSSDVATSRNPFSHPTKVFKNLKAFPVHTSLQTNYFYMVNQKISWHTLTPPQKKQQFQNYDAPLWSERKIQFSNSDWRLMFHPSAESSIYWPV